VYSKIEGSINKGGPLVGSNFWAWGGYGKALHDDAVWREGDKTFVGDPPQEPQGLNSIFVTDGTTLGVLSKHAANIAN
jgi:mannan endo-1,4-beta-mannosidase